MERLPYNNTLYDPPSVLDYIKSSLLSIFPSAQKNC